MPGAADVVGTGLGVHSQALGHIVVGVFSPVASFSAALRPVETMRAGLSIHITRGSLSEMDCSSSRVPSSLWPSAITSCSCQSAGNCCRITPAQKPSM
jgi:hypothetical protein